MSKEQYALGGWRIPAALFALGLPGVVLFAVVRVGAWRIKRFGELLTGGDEWTS